MTLCMQFYRPFIHVYFLSDLMYPARISLHGPSTCYYAEHLKKNARSLDAKINHNAEEEEE